MLSNCGWQAAAAAAAAMPVSVVEVKHHQSSVKHTGIGSKAAIKSHQASYTKALIRRQSSRFIKHICIGLERFIRVHYHLMSRSGDALVAL